MKSFARRAFTLVEALVALVIIAGLTALIAPVISDRIRATQISSLATTLENVRTGILNFRTDVGRYPGKLYMLQRRPNGDPDICSATIGSAVALLWRGPYIALRHAQLGGSPDATGLAAGDYQLNDAFVRTVATATSMQLLAVQVPNVRIADANRLNTLVDGLTVPPQAAGADTAGAIRWAAPGTAISTTINYIIPTLGC